MIRHPFQHPRQPRLCQRIASLRHIFPRQIHLPLNLRRRLCLLLLLPHCLPIFPGKISHSQVKRRQQGYANENNP